MAKLEGIPTLPRSSFSSLVKARHSGPRLMALAVSTRPQSWQIVSPWSKSSMRCRLPHSGQTCILGFLPGPGVGAAILVCPGSPGLKGADCCAVGVFPENVQAKEGWKAGSVKHI